MNQLENIYKEKCIIPSDIHEHLPILKKYTEECDHVTELGVRWVVSTYAFMMGKPTKLISYDIQSIEDFGTKIDFLVDLAKENGTHFEFHVASSLDNDIEETDLLFIDTEHSYLQLKAELAKHGNKARKYLIFHDTKTFGHNDSSAYGDQGLKQEGEEKHGLIPAIEEFLQNNPHWEIHEVFENNNGLTILKRK